MLRKLFRALPYPAIIILGLWGVRALLQPESFTNHDGTSHLSRLAQYITAIADGQWPPRWSATLYGGLGYPIFVYSYHVPFALGALFHSLGAKLSDSIELVLGLSYILSGIGMYAFLKEHYAKWAALTGAVFYLYAPYRFSLIFVRAAIGEATAIAFLPWILYAISRYKTTGSRKFFAAGAILIAGAIASHSLFLIMYLPVVALYALAIFRPKMPDLKKSVIKTGLIIVAALALSSFYWTSLVFERHYSVFDSVYSSQGSKYLVTYKQLIKSKWGYGFDYPNTDMDEMSFQLGLAQMAVVTLAGLYALSVLTKYRKGDPLAWFSLFLFGFSVLLMMENPVTRLFWEKGGLLKAVDFPWRFLGLTTFAAATAAAYLTAQIKYKAGAAILLTTLALYSNRGFQALERKVTVDESKVWRDPATTAYVNEYRPRWRTTEELMQFDSQATSDRPGEEWQIVTAKSNYIELGTNFTETGLIRINQVYFPGWRAYRKESESWREIPLNRGFSVVGAETDKETGQDIEGTMRIEAEPGRQQYKLVFGETPLRLAADLISLATLIMLMAAFLKPGKTK